MELDPYESQKPTIQQIQNNFQKTINRRLQFK